MAFDVATLALIKVDYEESDLTLNQIGEKNGCSGAYICKLAKLHGWKRRAQRAGCAPPRPRQPRNERSAIARRMCKVINGKLKQMEKGMQSGELNSADLEHDAKMVGSMIGGLQKFVAAPEEDKLGNQKAAKAGAVDEVKRLQREIIELG